MTVSAWTEDRIERLKTLWREGKTAEQIALELQNGISRSAVLGKVHRMGLSAGRPARPRIRGAKKARRPGEPDPGVMPDPVARATTSSAGTPAQDACVPERPSTGPDIVTVRRGQCRWPYGDPGEDFVLCGRPVVRGAFCDGHAAVGYRAPPGGAASLLALADLN